MDAIITHASRIPQRYRVKGFTEYYHSGF